MWKHIAANGLSFLIVAFIAFAGVIGWGQREFTTGGPLEQAIFFEVERGASLRAISERLAEEGTISSAVMCGCFIGCRFPRG